MSGDQLSEFQIIENWQFPREQALVMGLQVFVHPATMMAMRHNGTPYWTRHMLGVKEAERERRIRTKQDRRKGIS